MKLRDEKYMFYPSWTKIIYVGMWLNIFWFVLRWRIQNVIVEGKFSGIEKHDMCSIVPSVHQPDDNIAKSSILFISLFSGKYSFNFSSLKSPNSPDALETAIPISSSFFSCKNCFSLHVKTGGPNLRNDGSVEYGIASESMMWCSVKIPDTRVGTY